MNSRISAASRRKGGPGRGGARRRCMGVEPVGWATGLALSLVLGLGAATAPAGQTRSHVDERTGVDAWVFEDTGIRVELIQRLPNQTRAFFLARGFDREAADHLASRCVFQTLIHNTFDGRDAAVEIRLAEWRALTPEGPKPLILEHQWQEEWKARGVGRAPRIAFAWALFPTHQHFQPGDWNMGMTTYPVAPGTPLDLALTWHVNGKTHRGRMRGMVCATDDLEVELQQ